MSVFGVIKDISLLEYLVRTFFIGIISFLIGRFIMKRAINQLTAYDFTVFWMLGAIIVAPLTDGEISFKYIIVPLSTLLFWHYIVSLLSFKSRKLGLFLNGKPTILVENGKILRKNFKKQFVNIDLFLSQLRLKNIFDISEVKYAILEPNGNLSVVKKETNRYVNSTDLKLNPKPVTLPVVVINDGKLFEDNLKNLKLNKEWLMDNLSIYNIDDISEVYLATIDNSKNLYVAKKSI
ncbi:DUF421 domain-containing protein [Tissierella praeacuta]|uniref:DUF421 domain-containing protein n=1 Tax=Tissierella praeacuta TaxID=43131 RepID=UPI00333ED8B8